jgi:5-methylcytosine-specific restriction endonuclease McrA
MVDSAVLVLNRHYQPIQITSVRRAFCLLYLGVARALDRELESFDFDSWSALAAHDSTLDDQGDPDLIRTVGRALRVPRVIVLQMYDRIPRTKVRFSRLNIYCRDENTCQYCGQTLPRSQLNLDHVVPRAAGGRTTWENIVCCCVPCNLKKGARTPEQAGMRLLKLPIRPRWTPMLRAHGGRVDGRVVRHREWLPFLRLVDASYWNTELEQE